MKLIELGVDCKIRDICFIKSLSCNYLKLSLGKPPSPFGGLKLLRCGSMFSVKTRERALCQNHLDGSNACSHQVPTTSHRRSEWRHTGHTKENFLTWRKEKNEYVVLFNSGRTYGFLCRLFRNTTYKFGFCC